MKKALNYLIVIVFALSLTACGTPGTLANVTRITEDNGVHYEMDGIKYYAFGDNADSLRGKQIGYIYDDSGISIHEVKGYPTSEWILEQTNSGEMDSSTLYKAENVAEIPAKLEQYRTTPDLRYEIMCGIIANEGRKLIVDSGAGWNFTLKKDLKLEGLDMSLKELAQTYYGIDVEQYYGKGIDVSTYDTIPMDVDDEFYNEYTTHLFIFTGNDLIFDKQLEDKTQFEAVKNICNQITRGNGSAWIN
ncbi:MAG: hypothetical protein LBL34_03280 [Clostridiales bacterium]|jgi:hypothetical protein|nr:hypothetical protein [Clostridiales bacterium]